MTRQWIVAGCIAGLLASVTGPARAASVTSDDFVAILGPSANFIAAAADLARAASGSRSIRAAARAQGDEARTLAAGLAAWRQDQARAAAVAAAAPTIDRLGPVANALSVPLEAIARTASAPGYPFTRLPSADRLGAAEDADLARLATLSGAPFDSFYAETDLAALRRIERACRDFVLNGDDETLRALAVHALPRIGREIAALERR